MFSKTVPSVLRRCLVYHSLKVAQMRLPKRNLSDTSTERHLPASSLKAKPTQSLQAPVKDADIITEQLQRAKTTDKVLELVSQHHGVMNNSQVLAAFVCLYETARQETETPIDKTWLTSQPSFRELCNRALKRMRFYETEEVLSLFKIITHFEIPAKSGLVQAVAQMLRHNLNSLSLQQLMFIDQLLMRQKTSSSLTDALKMAIPLVFQTQLPIQLDFSNKEDVLRCFKFVCAKELDSALIERLAVSLLSHMSKLDAEQAASAVLTVGLGLPQLRQVPGVIDLLRAAEHVVVSQLSSYPPKLIRAFLACFARGVYIRYLLEALVRKAMEEDWELWQLSLLLDGCQRNSYATPELSEYVADRVIKDPRTLLEDPRVSINTFIEAVAACPQQKPLFREAGQALSACREKLDLLKLAAPHLFVKTTVNLASLHCFPKELLENVFCKEFLYKAKFKVPKKSWPGMLKDLLQLDQGIQIELRGYEGPMLPDTLKKESIDVVARESSTLLSLKRCLETALGGEQFIRAAVWTRSGYFVDFAVVMRKGEYPMAINTQPQYQEEGVFVYIDDFKVPEDSKILAVLTADVSSYWRNTTALRGSVVTKMRHLSTAGLYPMLVNVEQWKSMPDHEKIPYLMREAKAILSEGDTSWALHMG